MSPILLLNFTIFGKSLSDIFCGVIIIGIILGIIWWSLTGGKSGKGGGSGKSSGGGE